MMHGTIPVEAEGLKLFRIAHGQLIACEAVRFPGGADAVGCVLRRASISGKVHVGGNLDNHFADVLDADGSMIGNVALDARSYRALKTRWMPCKLEQASE